MKTAASLLAFAVGILDASARAQDATSSWRDEEGFVVAGPGRTLALPADHGSHPETRTEWWYVTGPLTGAGGERFAFQATWFRRALRAEVPPGRSPLAVRDVLFFHGALTELESGRRHTTDVMSRAWDPWARARAERLDLGLFSHELVAEADARAARLRCGAGEIRLSLTLDLGAGRPLPHGREPGLSLKGRRPGEASWYYSVPRIPVTGTLERPGRSPLEVRGEAWFDHEFGSLALAEGLVGWDWFSVALDDGTDLMVYALRRQDGTADPASAGSLRLPEGGVRHLEMTGFALEVTDSWRSPASGAVYPSGWDLRVPGEELSLRVVPVVRDQEVRSTATMGIDYWEGLCRFTGTRAGAAVSGEGFVELVGYAEPIRDRMQGAFPDR